MPRSRNREFMIESQLGCSAAKVRSHEDGGGAAVSRYLGAKKVRMAWRLGNLAQICDAEFTCEVLDASKETLPHKMFIEAGRMASSGTGARPVPVSRN